MPNENMQWLEEYMDKAKAGLLETPPYASWIITRACNLKCYYCFANARKRDPDEVTTEEAKRILEDFAENGLAHVTFLGGEPLTRKDIFELIDYSTDLGIYTALLTNGLLVKKDTVQRLHSVGCEMIGVSIDSNDPAMHDAVRGVAGSLVGAKRTVREAIQSGMRCSVRVVVTEQSYSAIPELFRWALDEGVEELILIPLFVVGRASGTPNDKQLDLAAKQLFFQTLDRLRPIAEPLGIKVPHQKIACCQPIDLTPPNAQNHHAGHAMGFEKSSGCKVGNFQVSVQPNGDIYPCPFVLKKIGNLREQSISEIWQRSSLLQRARSEDLGCLVRSMIHLGRPDVADPTYSPSVASR